MTAADAAPTTTSATTTFASTTSATTTFDCPRCVTQVTERFWGPCSECRQDLALSTGKAVRQDGTFEATRFEPAMHVTPNHVATKD